MWGIQLMILYRAGLLCAGRKTSSGRSLPYNRPMLRLPLFTALLACAAAAATTVPTIDESLSMKSAGGAQISPDGRYVAYTVTETDWDGNDFVSQIWVAITATGERYQLTRGAKSLDRSAMVARFAAASHSPPIATASGRSTSSRPTAAKRPSSRRKRTALAPSPGRPTATPSPSPPPGPNRKPEKDRKEKYGEFDIIGGDYSHEPVSGA